MSATRPAPDLRADWQKTQGAACGCRGGDDMCPCQNENPWPRPAVELDTVARAIALADQRLWLGNQERYRRLARAAMAALGHAPESEIAKRPLPGTNETGDVRPS